MKYALITGSSRGIGAEIAKQLGRNGYAVAVCYNTSRVDAQKVAEEIAAGENLVLSVKMDLDDPSSVKEAFDYVYRRFPKIDLLVNNAAVDVIRPFEELEYNEWQKIVNVNLTGAFLTCKEVCAKMRDEGGTVINVSSIWAKKGASCESAYSAAKAGLEGFTRSFPKEYPMIKTYAVSLGYVDTDMNLSLDEEDISSFLAENPEVERLSPSSAAERVLATLEEDVESGATVYLW